MFDVRLYHSRKVNKHRLGAAIVLFALIGASWVSGWLTTPFWFFGWWLIFDACYNILIGQKWNYIGETAWLDRMQRKYPAVTWFKYLGFIASIVILII